MKQITILHMRRLLQAPIDEDVMATTLSPDANTLRRHYRPPTSPLDSSMALTILVLLTAIFFMGFFSIYLRRFAQEQSAEIRHGHGHRHRHTSRPSTSSVGLYNNRKGKGLDLTTIEALPLVSYGEDAKQLITDCPICLSEFEVKEIVKMIPHCKHIFHPHCLDTWLLSHVSCPLCRSTQLFINHDDEVCLNVKEVESITNAMTELQGRSTENRADTWNEGPHLGLRRTCSCTNFGDHIVLLQRSMSF